MLKFHRVISGSVCALIVAGFMGFESTEPEFGFDDYDFWEYYHWSYMISMVFGVLLSVLFFVKLKPSFEVVLWGYFFSWIGVFLAGNITEICEKSAIWGRICYFPPVSYLFGSVFVTCFVYFLVMLVGDWVDGRRAQKNS